MEPVRAAPVFMYQRVQREDVVRIPPERLGEDIDAVARELTRTTLEGKIGADKTLTLIASNIERVGEGRIVHGDGAVYQRVRYDALVFAPALQEIVEGTVVKIPKACKNCGHVTDEDKCPLCGGETSKDWQGYVIIVDHQRSEIAKKMGIHVNGKFALRVR